MDWAIHSRRLLISDYAFRIKPFIQSFPVRTFVHPSFSISLNFFWIHQSLIPNSLRINQVSFNLPTHVRHLCILSVFAVICLHILDLRTPAGSNKGKFWNRFCQSVLHPWPTMSPEKSNSHAITTSAARNYIHHFRVRLFWMQRMQKYNWFLSRW